MTRKTAEQQRSMGADEGGLLSALLGGLLGSPVRRNKLAEIPQEPAGLELGDDVHQVSVRVDPQDLAVVDKSEGIGQPLASANGTREEEVASSDGEGPDPTFTAPVVDLPPCQ